MCPEGQNDSPKDIAFQSFDLILEPGERLHVVSHLLLTLGSILVIIWVSPISKWDQSPASVNMRFHINRIIIKI